MKVSKKSKSLKHNKKHKSSAKKATKKKSSKKSKRPKQDSKLVTGLLLTQKLVVKGTVSYLSSSQYYY